MGSLSLLRLPVGLYDPWDPSICPSNLVEAGQVLSSTLSTLGTKVDFVIRVLLVQLCFVSFSPSRPIRQKREKHAHPADVEGIGHHSYQI